jgi:hypothetical protein
VEAYSLKKPVIGSKDYILYIENFDGQTFIHCDCWKWSKTIKKELRKDVDSLVQKFSPLFAFHEKQDKKHFKFLKLMGFNFFNDIKCADEQTRELFIRRK